MKSENEAANIYATVLDCSGLYYMEKTGKYQCTMKLIDQSLNLDRHEPLTATVFARSASEIPHVAKVGSIIRMHRAQTRKFNKQLYINCDVNYRSAWVLFDPVEGVTPISESGRDHTFTPSDKNTLAEMRKFTKNFFAKNSIECATLKEAEKTPKDFDTLCLIVDVKKKGNSTKVSLCDAEKSVKLNIPESQKLTVITGEVVRIRSANYTDTKKFDTIELNEYSNILKVADDYKSAKELMGSINSGKNSEKVKSKLAVNTLNLTSPIVASRIRDAHKQTKVTSLDDLFAGEGGKSGQKYFKVQVNVTNISPKNPKEWIWAYDKKTRKQCSLDEAFKGKKSGKLPSHLEYFYKMQMYVQDKNSKDGNLFVLSVSTLDSECRDFVSIDLGRDYPSEKTLVALKKIYKTLLNQFVSLNAMVKVQDAAGKQAIFSVVDTVLTI